MYRIGGEDFVAVGTDFDGFSGAKEMEISDIGEMPLLSEALKSRDLPGGRLKRSGMEMQSG